MRKAKGTTADLSAELLTTTKREKVEAFDAKAEEDASKLNSDNSGCPSTIRRCVKCQEPGAGRYLCAVCEKVVCS